MPRFTDTIAALATPAGTAAIAVVRASGPDTERLAREIFASPPLARVAHHADYRDARGVLVDDVLFTFFRGPQSYTGEDSLEVSCHGNPFIAQKILEDFFARGCRPAEPGEFTKRAFLNGRMDLSQAEAVMDLIRARSDQALAAANQQLRGALGRRMSQLIERLLDVLARIEAYIDFPDEDLPPEDRAGVLRDLDAIALDTDRLLATSHYGELLRDGIKTVILGAPNAGKSSLLNRLVGRERALVSPEPGTTRDFIEERVMIGAHCLRIIDTAGLNPSPTPIERLGIEKTFEQMDEAEIFLVVFDVTVPPPDFPLAVVDKVQSKKSLILLNKNDLSNYNSPLTNWLNIPTVRISALTGAGIDELSAAIVQLADSLRAADNSHDSITINARHACALNEAKENLSNARRLLRDSEGMELIAGDLRNALNAYSEIAGSIDNERVLDALFAKFCIGK